MRYRINFANCRIATRLAIATVLTANSQELQPVEIVPHSHADLPHVKTVKAITGGPKHHFFGYYGVNPWDFSNRRLACLEVDFGDRLVQADDRAAICLVDETTGGIRQIARTSSWNLQQGAMLFWLGKGPNQELMFNDRVDGKLVSVAIDSKGQKRTIAKPVAALSHDGRSAIGVDFDRLRAVRPVTGYAGGSKIDSVDPHPKNDGLLLVNLAGGNSRLLVSIDQCWRMEPLPEGLATQPFWIEHPVYNKDDTKVFFIIRAFDAKSRQLVSLPMCVNFDGSGLKSLLPWGIGGVSHFDWLDDRRVALTRLMPTRKFRHLLFDVSNNKYSEMAPDVLKSDGHCSFSPDGRWMITDTYPDKNRRQSLFVLNVKTATAARIATFHTPTQYRSDWRCDLHPRWDQSSSRICIDSTHSGKRQIYVVELGVPGFK